MVRTIFSIKQVQCSLDIATGLRRYRQRARYIQWARYNLKSPVIIMGPDLELKLVLTDIWVSLSCPALGMLPSGA